MVDTRSSSRGAPRAVGVRVSVVIAVVLLLAAVIAVIAVARAARLAAVDTASAHPVALPLADAGNPSGVDPAWLSEKSAATGIPPRALRAYAAAHLTLAAENPTCGIGWNTLAGIGEIESDHGRHAGGALGEDGYPDPAIRGIPLDGTASAAISDTDEGAWDGDATWDRAVGPLQFIPDTWVRWGADGDGDGAADPNQIDDAALAAARYLCAAGAMTSIDGWRTAVFSYNHLDAYVDDVAGAANRYAMLAGQ